MELECLSQNFVLSTKHITYFHKSMRNSSGYFFLEMIKAGNPRDTAEEVAIWIPVALRRCHLSFWYLDPKLRSNSNQPSASVGNIKAVVTVDQNQEYSHLGHSVISLSKRAMGCPCSHDNSVEEARSVGGSPLEDSEIINIIDPERLPVGTCHVSFFLPVPLTHRIASLPPSCKCRICAQGTMCQSEKDSSISSESIKSKCEAVT